MWRGACASLSCFRQDTVLIFRDTGKFHIEIRWLLRDKILNYVLELKDQLQRG